MILWAVVPAKDPAQAKSRLAGVFTPEQRRVLSLRLLERTLLVLRQVPAVLHCVVISAADEPLALAQRLGAQALHEGEHPVRTAIGSRSAPAGEVHGRTAPPVGGQLGHASGAEEPMLNAALYQAAASAAGQGADAILVLPADLPCLTPAAVAELIASVPATPGVALAPDRRHSGTNALLVRPPLMMPFRFGTQSFERHRETAARHGIPVAVCDHPAFALDLDTPDDVRALAGQRHGELGAFSAEQLVGAVLSACDWPLVSGQCA
ncbi:MAG TPA: hypothetical protein VHB98_03865 [Chloroflexota bacterium]|nr:hypothetical protein [Chloroflexota bacterium]